MFKKILKIINHYKLYIFFIIVVAFVTLEVHKKYLANQQQQSVECYNFVENKDYVYIVCPNNAKNLKGLKALFKQQQKQQEN